MPDFTTGVLIFVQINDVYFIDARADYADEIAVVPRVATLVKRLRRSFGRRRVIFCLPGDFLAPSCLSKHFNGRHMVAVLNKMRLDYVTIGNHELERRYTPADFFGEYQAIEVQMAGRELRSRGSGATSLREARQKAEVLGHAKLSERAFCASQALPIPTTTAPMARRSTHRQTRATSSACGTKSAPGSNPTNAPISSMCTDPPEARPGHVLRAQCPEFHLIMGGHDHHVMYSERIGRAMIVKTLPVECPLGPPELRDRDFGR